MSFSGKNRDSVFSCTTSDFLRYLLFSDVVRHTLLKTIHIHNLDLLNFVYIVVFDVKTASENAKLVILERLELQIFYAPSQP